MRCLGSKYIYSISLAGLAVSQQWEREGKGKEKGGEGEKGGGREGGRKHPKINFALMP